MTLVAIISANRPYQVSKMEEALPSSNPVWFVPKGQGELYAEQGAKNIKEVDGTLPMKSIQLNYALDEGFANNEPVVTLDDDFVWVKRVFIDGEQRVTVNISLERAIEELLDLLKESRFHLAGVSATTNALWVQTQPKFRGSLTGQIMAQTPSVVRYDPDIKSFVDNEYCMAHHAEHGGLIMHTQLLANFHMLGRSASADKKYDGGFKNLRTKETHFRACQVMTERYGVYVEPVEPGQRRKVPIRWQDIHWKGEPSWITK
jgi:hypothetical protein